MSLILNTATRLILPLLLLLSVYLLLRGHDAPGGGFIAGLVAVAAFSLHALGSGVAAARRALRVDPHHLCGAGLLVAAGSGVVGLLAGAPFLTGRWASLAVPGVGPLKLGTPLFFDLGVYLVVIGALLMIILTLADD